MLKPSLVAAFLTVAAPLLLACGSSDSSESADDTSFKCQLSVANSGDLCQVNFFCDDGTDPAAYCSSDGNCDCGPKADNPKTFSHPGICDLEMNARAKVVNDECGFGM